MKIKPNLPHANFKMSDNQMNTKQKFVLTALLFTFLLFFKIDLSFGQQLEIKPYKLISQNKDTLLAELCKFKVPLSRSNTKLDSIKIYFVRLKSTNTKPGNPIIYLAGGPGSSGIETAKGKRFSIFKKLREVADVIILDQRGTGLSNNIPNCLNKINFDLEKPIQRNEYVVKTKDNIEKCLDFWKEKNVNIWAYNTTENAKDLEDLRKILKIQKISLWGLSYGSHLAFEYIRLYEKKIDKLVLASLEGPNETIKYPRDTEAFLFNIAELAKSNYGSEKKYLNLKLEIETVHQRLIQKPIVVALKNMQGTIDSIGISNFELQSAISTFYLKNPEDSKILPALYTKMYNGDFTDIARQVFIMKQYILNGTQSMPFSMDMSSGISKRKNIEIENQIENSILGSTINFLFYEWMNVITYAPLPKRFRKMKSNNVEALLFSGTMDGRTYLTSGIEIAEKFKRGRHVIVENGGHDIYEQSAKIADEVFNFFMDIPSNKKKIELSPVIFD